MGKFYVSLQGDELDTSPSHSCGSDITGDRQGQSGEEAVASQPVAGRQGRELNRTSLLTGRSPVRRVTDGGRHRELLFPLTLKSPQTDVAPLGRVPDAYKHMLPDKLALTFQEPISKRHWALSVCWALF